MKGDGTIDGDRIVENSESNNEDYVDYRWVFCEHGKKARLT